MLRFLLRDKDKMYIFYMKKLSKNYRLVAKVFSAGKYIRKFHMVFLWLEQRHILYMYMMKQFFQRITQLEDLKNILYNKNVLYITMVTIQTVMTIMRRNCFGKRLILSLEVISTNRCSTDCIEPRQYLKDASIVVLEDVQNII